MLSMRYHILLYNAIPCHDSSFCEMQHAGTMRISCVPPTSETPVHIHVCPKIAKCNMRNTSPHHVHSCRVAFARSLRQIVNIIIVIPAQLLVYT